MKFETAAIHVGQEPEEVTGAIIVPIFQTATYAQPAIGEHKGYEYSRTHNPTRTAMQECLAALEGGRHGLAFASGMAAASTTMTLLKQGDHIISSDDVYGGIFRVFEKVFREWGFDFTFVNTSDLSEIEAAIKPTTKMLWMETPTNPLLKITDLKGAADIAKRHNLISVVDNTFASPYFQRPLEHGADIVLHSTSKFLNGHADVVGGALVTSNDQLHERLAFSQNAMGTIPGPFDSWLILRGMKTLGVRMRQHEANAKAVVDHLKSHKRVKTVLYPGLPEFPNHDVAKKQMSGFGSLISFYIDGGEGEARSICKSTRVFRLAESLGGVESLIEHPALMTHASIPREMRESRGLGDSLIRLSVGIEHADDLIADLDQALASF
ncbi:MAG: cystathionine gamma-synthase [candidate division Zixibacteria bacterium]|nr:cystathionine gamma-synthase [candidate division Zixibacteria bacterium]